MNIYQRMDKAAEDAQRKMVQDLYDQLNEKHKARFNELLGPLPSLKPDKLKNAARLIEDTLKLPIYTNA